MTEKIKEKCSDILIYQAEDGKTRIDVRLEDKTVWLTQIAMAGLFQTSVPNINMHIKNVFEEGELREKGTIKDYLIVQDEGPRKVKRNVNHYNLDVIIAIGYRVRCAFQMHRESHRVRGSRVMAQSSTAYDPFPSACIFGYYFSVCWESSFR